MRKWLGEIQSRKTVTGGIEAGIVVENHKNRRGLLENCIKGWWTAKEIQSAFERELFLGTLTKLTHIDFIQDKL